MEEEQSTTKVDDALLIPNLPDDISLQIIARLPLSHHPKLYLVSKRWRCTLTSRELYHIRSQLHTSETSLCLALRVSNAFLWYTRRLNDVRTPLIPIPSLPQTPHPVGFSLQALGPQIYLIGGSINDVPTNNVWIFDCRFNKWELGPKMKVAREFCAAGVCGGKIYVVGGCNVDNWARSLNWAEVYDPKKGVWSAVESSGEVDLVRDKWMHASAVIEGRFYAMADRGGVVYDIAHGTWGSVPKRLDLGWRGRAAVVGNVLYCYDYLGKIRGYDVNDDTWKDLKGVERGLPKFLCSSTMVELNGKLCVVWEGKAGGGKDVVVMCAEIEVARDENGGLMGRVLRVDELIVLPKGTSISHCLAVDL